MSFVQLGAGNCSRFRDARQGNSGGSGHDEARGIASTKIRWAPATQRGPTSDRVSIYAAQPTLTSIFRGFAFSFLGSLRVRTPCFNSAAIFSASTSSGNSNCR